MVGERDSFHDLGLHSLPLGPERRRSRRGHQIAENAGTSDGGIFGGSGAGAATTAGAAGACAATMVVIANGTVAIAAKRAACQR